MASMKTDASSMIREEIAGLGVRITTHGVDEAAQSMQTLASAAERLASALERIQGQPHGGVEFTIVGEVCHAEVKPLQ